jgi:hypothetical protein
MARGWESKSVEEQQAEFGKKSDSAKAEISEQDKLRATEKKRLELARASVFNQLKLAQNPRYIELLTGELAELDKRISELSEPSE